jgi:hypothetical protein
MYFTRAREYQIRRVGVNCTRLTPQGRKLGQGKATCK